MSVTERLEALYRLGGGEGANRLGLTTAEEDAHRLVEGWMHDAGLGVSRDAVGNLYGRLLGNRPELPEIWVGSHLDTVPDGGRYDGTLGVVAAIEAARHLEVPLQRTLAVVAFRDEEGARFGHGFFGSRAVAGMVDERELERTDRDGVSVRDALALLGINFQPSGGWLCPRPAAFLELHIEQGPVLAAAGAALGIVTSIVGMVELEVTFTGDEGHAGTTPMALRRDAGLAAAHFQVAVVGCATAIPEAVATTGRVTLMPGAGNVVPRRAELVVDARAPDSARLTVLEQRIRDTATGAAHSCNCSVEVELVARTEPVQTAEALVSALADAAPQAPRLLSGAGHDAQVLGAAGVPVGMLFVRSLASGISHSPREETQASDIAAAITALAPVLQRLCTRPCGQEGFGEVSAA